MTANSPKGAPLKRRYLDAYRVGKALVTAGKAIKILGFIPAALLMALGAWNIATLPMLGSQADQFSVSPEALAALVVLSGLGLLATGIVIGIISFILGTLLSAQGQVLRAQLDGAVYACPFLTEEEKWTVLELPESTAV